MEAFLCCEFHGAVALCQAEVVWSSIERRRRHGDYQLWFKRWYGGVRMKFESVGFSCIRR